MRALRLSCAVAWTVGLTSASLFGQAPALLPPGEASPSAEPDASPSAPDRAAGAADTADIDAELTKLLRLTRLQQKERARQLIRKYPDSRIAPILKRLLEEYAAYDQVADAEQQVRDARTAGYRAYWQSRCCPPPLWNPPTGQIMNGGDEPVLYEIRYSGVHRTLWMGPYRLSPGATYTSAHPYAVRYITGDGFREQWVVPGEAWSFRGAPGTTDFRLDSSPATPATPASPTPPAPTLPIPEADVTAE